MAALKKLTFLTLLLCLWTTGCNPTAPLPIPTAQPLTATAAIQPDTDPAAHTPSPPPSPTATLAQTPEPTPTPPLLPTATTTPAARIAAARSDFTNIYSGPGTDYILLAILSSGFRVEVVGIDPGGGWVVVGLPHGDQGWVQTERLSTEQSLADLPAIPAPPKPPPTTTPVPVPSVIIAPIALAPNAEYAVTLLNFGSREWVTIKVVFATDGSLVLKTLRRTREDGSTELTLRTSRSAEEGAYLLTVTGDQSSFAEATYYVGPPP